MLHYAIVRICEDRRSKITWRDRSLTYNATKLVKLTKFTVKYDLKICRHFEFWPISLFVCFCNNSNSWKESNII